MSKTISLKLKDIADLVDGKIEGDEDAVITNVANIENADQHDLTFLSDQKYKKFFNTTKASVILVNKDFDRSRKNINYLIVDRPYKAFLLIIENYFSTDFPLKGIDPTSSIDNEVSIGKNVAIGKNVVINSGCKIGDNSRIFHNTIIMRDVEIGSDAIIFPNVTIREESIIGDRVIIHPGAVIGSDGFGYQSLEDGSYKKIPQIGIVIIEDDVEIGANTCIDRAAFGKTIIEKGSKLDNLVQIAHNVRIGEHTAISSQCGIAGSTIVGKHNILAGQVGLVDHIQTGDNVILGAQSGITKSLPQKGIYFGYPAKELKSAQILEAHIRNLPNYSEKIKQLEKKIEELEAKLKK